MVRVFLDEGGGPNRGRPAAAGGGRGWTGRRRGQLGSAPAPTTPPPCLRTHLNRVAQDTPCRAACAECDPPRALPSVCRRGAREGLKADRGRQPPGRCPPHPLRALSLPSITHRYILVYPQGCDVCNHLSLFLCVADYDKLLPGELREGGTKRGSAGGGGERALLLARGPCARCARRAVSSSGRAGPAPAPGQLGGADGRGPGRELSERKETRRERVGNRGGPGPAPPAPSLSSSSTLQPPSYHHPPTHPHAHTHSPTHAHALPLSLPPVSQAGPTLPSSRSRS